MNKFSVIKRVLRVALHSAVLGMVMTAGAAYAADAAKGADLVLNGDAKCTKCHDESDSPEVLAIAKTKHGVRADARTPTCTSCHGDSENHRNNPSGAEKRPTPDRTFTKGTKTPVAERNESCLACHKNDSKRHLWSGSAHDVADVACSNCHQVHAEHDKVREKRTQAEVCFACHKSQRAETHKLSGHPLDAGKMACSDCHNPHGSTGPKLLLKNTVNDTCFTCHAEKRGPFLWEHQPATDDCTNCHLTHGSNVPSLLKTRPPMLCQECHQDHGAGLKDGSGVVSLAGTPPLNTVTTPAAIAGKYLSVQANGRKCLNCHVMVHGSNHPAGAAFTR